METVFDEVIDMLMKDGYPRDLLVRFINACIDNYYSDERIIKELKKWIIPNDIKADKKYLKERIETLRLRTCMELAIEVLPLPTKEVIDLINKKRKFIE